jgi:hypothetical protein
MKTLASLAFGAMALTAASIGLAQPASARGDVGVYVGPGGFGLSVESYRNYCRDRWYRHNHWNYCRRFYGGEYNNGYGYYNNGYNGYGYYNNGYGYSNDRDDRYRDRRYDRRDEYRHRHHDRDDDGYRNRDDDRDDGGERGW